MCQLLYVVLQRLSAGVSAPSIPCTVVAYGDNRLSYVNSNTVIVIPQYVNFINVIVNVASLGVPLKPADYNFNQSTGTITIYNFQLLNGDAVYLIPAN